MAEFITRAEMIQKNHSGWSGVKCSLCQYEITNAAYSYSMKFFGEPLCRSCQRLRKDKTQSNKRQESVKSAKS